MRSSDASWLSSNTNVQPNTAQYPELGFPGPKDSDKKGSQVMAVAITGGFTSAVAKPKDQPDPAAKDAADREVIAAADNPLSPEELLRAAGMDYTQIEEFYEELREAVRTGKIEEFRPNHTAVLLRRHAT